MGRAVRAVPGRNPAFFCPDPCRSNAKFIKCDVRSWDDQVAVFDGAVSASPKHSVDVVVANAGIVGADDVFTLDGNFTLSVLFPLLFRTKETKEAHRHKQIRLDHRSSRACGSWRST